MTTADWKVGDWVIFDLRIGQIKELRDGGFASFTDGTFETSGRLVERFRPLTLRGKVIIENFDAYYDRLRTIDGEAGFNYPDISQHFCELALRAIDQPGNEKEFYKEVQEFIEDARRYVPMIQSISLFRRNTRRKEATS